MWELLWREAARGIGSTLAELLGRWALPGASPSEKDLGCPACVCECKCLAVDLQITIAVGGGVAAAIAAGVLCGRWSALKQTSRARRTRDDRVLFNADELR